MTDGHVEMSDIERLAASREGNPAGSGLLAGGRKALACVYRVRRSREAYEKLHVGRFMARAIRELRTPVKKSGLPMRPVLRRKANMNSCFPMRPSVLGVRCC